MPSGHRPRGRQPSLVMPVLLLAALAAAAMLFVLVLLWPRTPLQQVPQVERHAAMAPAYEDFERLPTSEEPEPATSPTPSAADHGLALIIDDIGYDKHALKRLLALNVPMAISVLPDAPLARETADLAYEAGQTVMLHLPMEPENRALSRRMSTAFLRATMDQAELRKTFLADLSKVPHVIGVNNHMGSLLTQMDAPMQWVMDLCRKHGLFFVDSRTHKDSVAAKMARDAGIAWASRRYFLDHRLDRASMLHVWKQATHCAQSERCILIAHPHALTLDFLEDVLGREHDIPIVRVTRLLHERGAS